MLLSVKSHILQQRPRYLQTAHTPFDCVSYLLGWKDTTRHVGGSVAGSKRICLVPYPLCLLHCYHNYLSQTPHFDRNGFLAILISPPFVTRLVKRSRISQSQTGMEFFVAGESASSNAFSQLTRQIRMVTLCTTNFNTLKILRSAHQIYLFCDVIGGKGAGRRGRDYFRGSVKPAESERCTNVPFLENFLDNVQDLLKVLRQ